MSDTVFVLILGSLGLLTTLVGLLKDRDKRYKKQWWRQLKKEDYIIIFIGICVLVFSIWQFRVSEKNKRNDQIRSQIDKKKADSILKAEINKGVDSNRKILFEDLSEALKKQMIKLDTFTNDIISLRDTVFKLYPETEPTLYILKDGVRIAPKLNSSKGFKITIDLVALNGDLTNFHISATCMLYYNDKLYYNDFLNLNKDYILIKNTSTTSTITSDILSIPNTIFILLKGYYNVKEQPSKKYFMEKVFRYLGGSDNLTYELYDGEKSHTLQLFKEKSTDGKTKVRGNFYDKKMETWMWK